MTEGILLIDKPKSKSSFYLVKVLRKLTQVKKIGHTGTLDPLATGVMVMLIGKKYTRMTPSLISSDKEYKAQILLGKRSNTYDLEGAIEDISPYIPSYEEVEKALEEFQGEVKQTPPMFSAKKIGGRKLYDLAREGKTIERKEIAVKLTTTLLEYTYPYISLHVRCSSGCYIRSIANDLGSILGCGGVLSMLTRVRCGDYSINECISLSALQENPTLIDDRVKRCL